MLLTGVGKHKKLAKAPLFGTIFSATRDGVSRGILAEPVALLLLAHRMIKIGRLS